MEDNTRVEHSPSTVLVGHLVDDDVFDSCFDVTKEHGGQDEQSHLIVKPGFQPLLANNCKAKG